MKKAPFATMALASISALLTLPTLSFAQTQPNTPKDPGVETKTYAAARITNPLGKALPCDALKQSIEEKLQSKNVKNYKLDVIDISADGEGKIVGRCDGGKHKIIYSKS